MEDGKSLESNIEEPSGVWGATCTESMTRNWRGPTLHVKRKEITYKPEGEVVIGGEEVGGDHSTGKAGQHNLPEGRVSTFIQVFVRR